MVHLGSTRSRLLLRRAVVRCRCSWRLLSVSLNVGLIGPPTVDSIGDAILSDRDDREERPGRGGVADCPDAPARLARGVGIDAQGVRIAEGFGRPVHLDAVAATHVVRSMRPVNPLHSDSVLQCPTIITHRAECLVTILVTNAAAQGNTEPYYPDAGPDGRRPYSTKQHRTDVPR